MTVLVLDYETLTPEGINITYYPYNDVCNIFNSPVYTDFNNGVNSFYLKNTDFVVFETVERYHSIIKPRHLNLGMEGEGGIYQSPRKRPASSKTTAQKRPSTSQKRPTTTQKRPTTPQKRSSTTQNSNNQNRRQTTISPQRKPTERNRNSTVQGNRPITRRPPVRVPRVEKPRHTEEISIGRPRTEIRPPRNRIRKPIYVNPNPPRSVPSPRPRPKNPCPPQLHNAMYRYPADPCPPKHPIHVITIPTIIEYPIISPILVRPTTSINTITYPTEFYYNEYLLGYGHTNRKPTQTNFYNRYGSRVNKGRYQKELAWEAIRDLKITELFAMTGYNITLYRYKNKMIVMYFQKRS